MVTKIILKYVLYDNYEFIYIIALNALTIKS